MSRRMKGQVSTPSSRSCDGRLNMLSEKLTVMFHSQHWLQVIFLCFQV